MSELKQDSGKILKFEKSAKYHFRKYQKHIDSGNYFASLAALRNAMVQEPDNPEYLLSYAELLTEIEHFYESNVVLFDMMQNVNNENAQYVQDIIFDIGCNFTGLQDYEKAAECFERYLYKYPNSEYSANASDMLQYIKSDSFEYEILDLPKEAYELSHKGKYLLDSGNYSDACILFKQLTKDYPEQSFLKNNLSLAYYCTGRVDDAAEMSLSILEDEPDNIHALCNLILFFQSMGDMGSYYEYLMRIDECKPQNADEYLKLMITYGEAGKPSKAYELVKPLSDLQPYDTRTLFLCAIVCINNGKYEQAKDILSNMLCIDPDDTVAEYYLGVACGAIADGETVYEIPYIYQVSPEEAKSRLRYLNSCMAMTYDEIIRLWKTPDNLLRKILIWGISLNDLSIKSVCINILISFHDEEAIRILKSFLLNENEPDSIKNEIFIMFNTIGVKQPYIAYISGKIAEVRVGSIENRVGLSKCHEELVSVILSSPYTESNKNIISDSIKTLNRYYSKFTKAPSVRNLNAWATAIIYYSMLESDPELIPSLGTMCKDMNADIKAVKRCYKLIENKLKGNLDE